MNHRLWAASLMLISLQSAANIRVIGNGGGEHEMLALTRYSMMKNYLRFCLRSPVKLGSKNLCDLNLAEQDLIAGAIATSIDRDADTLIPERLLAAGMDANRAMLLGLLEFSVYRSYQKLEQYPENWENLSHKLFAMLDWKSADLFIPATSQHLRTFEISGSIQRAHVFLENEQTGQSQEITSDLVRQLPCTDQSLQLRGVQGRPRLESTGFSADLKWDCKGTQYLSRLIAVPEDKDQKSAVKTENKSVEPSWHFSIFTTQIVEPISCPQTLINPRK